MTAALPPATALCPTCGKPSRLTTASGGECLSCTMTPKVTVTPTVVSAPAESEREKWERCATDLGGRLHHVPELPGNEAMIMFYDSPRGDCDYEEFTPSLRDHILAALDRAKSDLDAQVTLTRITGESLARAQERLANATQSTVEMGAEILGLRDTVLKLVMEREARLRIIASLPLDDPAVVECMALRAEVQRLNAENASIASLLDAATREGVLAVAMREADALRAELAEAKAEVDDLERLLAAIASPPKA